MYLCAISILFFTTHTHLGLVLVLPFCSPDDGTEQFCDWWELWRPEEPPVAVGIFHKAVNGGEGVPIRIRVDFLLSGTDDCGV